jgi:hypothetical protein
MSLALEGKVALVVGGTSGVGLGSAQELVDQGVLVVITVLRQDQLEDAVATIGPKSWGIAADVTALADVVRRPGYLDMVCGNGRGYSLLCRGSGSQRDRSCARRPPALWTTPLRSRCHQRTPTAKLNPYRLISAEEATPSAGTPRSSRGRDTLTWSCVGEATCLI